ncbi:hypothetical protein NDU88_004910 [Pleurodeles waltl]|uniref:Uncharacterized protein n=1 Tax=Pleurodeles waltl TaxID=8319 RepID=A0AAV7TTV0_PLEWA|nr:hypothetical protein NDU88_004910 [Pleurodeles waltl]
MSTSRAVCGEDRDPILGLRPRRIQTKARPEKRPAAGSMTSDTDRGFPRGPARRYRGLACGLAGRRPGVPRHNSCVRVFSFLV